MGFLRPTDPPASQIFKPPALLGSLFLSGFAPILRGTSGTLVAALPSFLALGMGPRALLWLWIGLAASFSVLSLSVGEWVLRRYPAIKDPGWFVLDEAAGFYLTCSVFAAGSPLDICFAFLTFRLYDMCKPWPVRMFERLPRSVGILADDLVAAVMAGLSCLGLRAVVQLL